MKEEYYPVNLNLSGKMTVVVGGGKVAERKVYGLLNTGATICVVSPELTAGLKKLADGQNIDWRQKSFSAEDIQEAALIIAATNNQEANIEVHRAASDFQLVSMADNPEHSDFIAPSVLKRGKLLITVSTSGASPSLAKAIRDDLAEVYDEKFENYLEFLHDCRQFILNNVADPIKKQQLLTAIIDPAFLNSNTREEEFEKLYAEILTTD
ncbi:siroheme synthase [Bacillus canaveralius]|uniref:precorrin-2 dehydrogenase n=1 Tax=Bacillus canaveralius TaxID=1403243 RepID=A0A2N5GM22_9BACI|nr:MULTISPECIES: NAD(P)-dependent oxidoreductase [Bacillus]PLR82906.1 siroheme synthase [Bacillus canaveralius]PLR85276.1 siroheme synthase [Bacillus sp. V33-4]PLR97089.1 siroheme synthase [Bacillus canaveralius]RSK55511.1 siroheme synthase [Bacillus canaveralius]